MLDSSNQFQLCRVLLDPGSQACFVTESCFNQLGLARNKARIQISCLGSSSAHTNGVTTLKFTPYFKESPEFATSAFLINKIIGDIPHFSLPSDTAAPFRDLKLADPDFFQSGPIDILLGVSIALPMLKGDFLKTTEDGPFAVRSDLGWIISGNVSAEITDSSPIHVNHLQVSAEELLGNFWKLDEVPTANSLTKEEQATEDHLTAAYSRGEDGRYTVKLPCHTSPALLGDSLQSAMRRLQSLERSLVSRPEAEQLTSELSKMMSSGGFRLHKWCSNVTTVLKSIPSDCQAIDHSLSIADDKTNKVLGIVWNPATDFFHASISTCDHQELTKRKILSDIAKLFDPMGWLAPVVIFAKIFIQELWSHNLGWNDVISDSLSSRWRAFHSQLSLLVNFKIPRFAMCVQPLDIQIHSFCDASVRAYCAVVYIRSVTQDQNITVRLLTSKTRVAPVKSQSLPRLELCSALLLTNLLESVLPTLEIPFSKVFAWSDSQVALSWISSEPRRWLPFVANRVAKIQEAVPDLQWNHVPGVENPADCGTRGLQPSEFLSCDLWVQGPGIEIRKNNSFSFLRMLLKHIKS